jgi:hypothetical protein
MGANDSDIQKYLAETQNHYANYHNHKENIAWAGLVLYVVLIGFLLDVFRKFATLSCESKAIFSALIAAAGAVICFYLSIQFKLLRRAADFVAACLFLKVQLLRNPGSLVSESFDVLPNKDSEMQSKHIIPRCIEDAATRLHDTGKGARLKLQNIGYGLVCAISVFAIIVIWCSK